MRSWVFSVHPGLARCSRVHSLVIGDQDSSAAALLTLTGAGVAAAVATVCLDLSLRIPGHAILRAVFPIALGLSLAPRRLGGALMGVAALGSVGMLATVGSYRIGAGALISLASIGPLLDMALWRTRSGWRLYLAFALAGLASNLMALTVRAGMKFGGLDHATARPLAAWWFQAVGTYALCGVLAGLISAAVWFRWSPNRTNESIAEHAS